MYLKSIELQGFKSFAEETDIGLQPGIVGVVGPNGCGKTNVSESIRWCLGELSAKSLRSKSMSDMIFNGTRRLSPATQVSVTLNFDNSDRKLDIDAAEVSVTRKAFRDGSSEYLINKAACRLKDIRSLFRGTGLGEDGYSIMEGRMVEFLLSAKPQDRRLMFDEASGAAKFASRRDETLNKLSKIEMDLDRVQDQIALINTERKHLEDQAKKAALHEKLTIQKKALQGAKLIKDAETLGGRIQNIKEGQLEPKTQELTTQSVKLNQLYAEVENLKLAKDERDREIVAATERYHQLLRERDVTLTSLRHVESNLASLRGRAAGTEQEKTTCEAEIARLEAEAATLQAQFNEKQEALNALGDPTVLENNPEQALQDAANAKRAELETQIKALKDLASETAQRITSIKNEIVSKTMESSELQVELKSTLREHRHLEMEKTNLETSINSLTTACADIQARLDAAQNDLQGVRGDMDALNLAKHAIEEKVYRDLPKQEATLRAKLEHYDSAMAASPDMKGAKALTDFQQELPGLYGPLSRMLQPLPQYNAHFKSILGDRLNWFVAENAETASRAIEHLRSIKKGRASVLLLDKITDQWHQASTSWNPSGETTHTIELDYALGNTDARTKKIISYLLGPTYLQGSAVYSQVVMQGGEDFDTNPKALSTLEEREEAERNLKTVTASQEEAAKELADIEGRIAGYDEKRKACENSIKEISIELAKQTQTLESSRRELALTKETATSLEREAQERLSSIAAIQEINTIKEQSVAEFDAALTAHQQELQGKEAEFIQYAQQTASLRETQLALELKFQKAKQEVELASERYNACASQLQAAKAKHDDFLRILEDLNTQAAELGKEQATLQEMLHELNANHQTKADELAQLQSLHGELVGKLNHIESEQNNLETFVEALKDETSRLEVELKTMEFEKSRVIEEATAFFGVPADQLSAKMEEWKQTEEMPDGEEDYAAKLLRITERLERMGAVNFLAQEEYTRLQERATFLETQRADILAARDDIKLAIGKINEQIAESFGTTFTAVRERFRSIFTKLFEGGEADLVLTNPDNISETGVEILAQPPGKKLQSITLLSQGEKALTAVSLLFAFFANRPSPVCVLDEIDAPLDENNVNRFCKMLKEFSEQSQFIIITHNKKTMAVANVLYGVTMEELGVSKIISVKLEEVPDAVPA